MHHMKQRLQETAATLTVGRRARSVLSGSPSAVPPLLPPYHEQVVDEWVDRAHPCTTVEANGEPEGFVAVCAPAPGAFAFAATAQEALDDMRSVLAGWAHFSLADGQELPKLPPG